MEIPKFLFFIALTITLASIVFVSGCTQQSGGTTTTTTTGNLVITVYCVNDNCTAHEISAGAGSLAQGCYRSQDECLSASKTVIIKGFSFQPSEIIIKAGEIVTWENEDSATHDVSFDEISNCNCPSGYILDGEACNPECYYSTPKCLSPSVACEDRNPPQFSQGGSFRRAFSETGTFNYHCGIHPSMKGKVIVE